MKRSDASEIRGDDMEVGGKLWKRDYLLLGAFSLALFSYACYGGRVLTQHEARLPQASIEMAVSGDWLVPTSGGRPWLERPPLPHWITIAVASVFGAWDQVWVFRLPNALAGMASVLMTGWLAARAFGRNMGILSGLILATSYEFMHYAWLAEEDVYLAATVLLCMLLFYRLEFDSPRDPAAESLALFGNRPTGVWVFFLVMGLSNLVKGLMFAAVMVGLAGGTWLLLSGNPRRILRYVWFQGGVVFAIAAVWWVAAVSWRYPEMLDIWFGDLKNRTDGAYSQAPFWLYGQTLLWAMMPWTIPAIVGLYETFQKARVQPASVERWLWCWCFVPILFLSIPAHKHHHYLVPCLAPWGILAAIGATKIWRTVPQWPAWSRQPAFFALLLGVPAAAGLFVFRERIPGPDAVPWIMALSVPIGVFAIGRALLDRHGARSLGVLLGVLVAGYCGAYSYHGLCLDRYRIEAEFLQSAAREVPPEEPIYLNGDGAILNTFRNLFYLGGRTVTLHNLTFLLDESISSREIYLVGMRDSEQELRSYGETEELLACGYVPRKGSVGSQWVLYRVTLDPNLERYPNDLRVSALQAMEREKGPYLGGSDSTRIRKIDYRR